MEEYAYSPRRSLYSRPYSFGDSQASPEFGLQNAKSFYGSGTAGIQLEDNVLVCFTGTLDYAIMFSLGIGTNSVSELETTRPEYPLYNMCMMCACECVPNKILLLVVARCATLYSTALSRRARLSCQLSRW